MKAIICKLFHFKHWEIYNTYYFSAPYRFIACKKCNNFMKIRIGEEVK